MYIVCAPVTFHESVVPPLLNGCTIVLNTHCGAFAACAVIGATPTTANANANSVADAIFFTVVMRTIISNC